MTSWRKRCFLSNLPPPPVVECPSQLTHVTCICQVFSTTNTGQMNEHSREICYPPPHPPQLSAMVTFINHPSAADMIWEQHFLAEPYNEFCQSGLSELNERALILDCQFARSGRAGVRKGIRILRQIHSDRIFSINVTIVTIVNLQRSIKKNIRKQACTAKAQNTLKIGMLWLFWMLEDSRCNGYIAGS